MTPEERAGLRQAIADDPGAEQWAFQYVSYGVTQTSLVCGSREEAVREAGRHHRGARIVRRLCGDWETDGTGPDGGES